MTRNMDFNYAAILLVFVIYAYFSAQQDKNSMTGKYFRHILGSVWCTAFLNVIVDFGAMKSEGVPGLLLRILCSVYAFACVMCAYSLNVYTGILVNDGRKKLIDRVHFILMIIYGLVCIVSVKYPFLCVVENNSLVRGRLYILLYILSGYFLGASFVRMVLNLTKLSERRAHGVMTFIVISFLGAICQYVMFIDNMVIYFIYAVATTVLFFAFETPDYQKLLQVTNELQNNRDELETLSEKSAELTRTVHELMKTSSWVIYFDENMNVTESDWSPQFKTMLGYSYEDDVNLSTLWQDSLHPDDKESTVKSFMEGLQGKEYRIEARLRSKDGSYKWYLCTGEVKKSDEGILLSYQGVIKDIDDEKYKEQLVEERLKALEDLEQSQKELKDALFEAQEASRAKTIFLSNMSHDIRTPMNAIVGYTQLAQSHLDDPEEIEESLSIIRSSGEHLLSLINDVLDMSRIESGKVKVENGPCNLENIMAEIKNMARGKLEEKKQIYITDFSGLKNKYVLCDRLRLNQILINCISNSVKYTPDGGQISVSLSEEECKTDGYVLYVFKVADTGIGMSKEFLEKIFEPFERASSTTTSQIQGTGLGMAITKNLIDMMNGTISAESELGKGSEFTIRIPLEIISESDFNEAVAGQNSQVGVDEMLNKLKGKHFLVVDDNKLNRSIVKKLLEQKDMTIEEASSGRAALDRLSTVGEGEIDIVFMDIQMPQMDGYEATDKINELDNPFAKEIPIIAMTANAFEEDKRMAREHGMVGHVTKPFKINELIETLYMILYEDK